MAGADLELDYRTQVQNVFSVTLRHFAIQWAERTNQPEPVKAWLDKTEDLDRDLHNFSTTLVNRINRVLEESNQPVPGLAEALTEYGNTLTRRLDEIRRDFTARPTDFLGRSDGYRDVVRARQLWNDVSNISGQLNAVEDEELARVREVRRIQNLVAEIDSRMDYLTNRQNFTERGLQREQFQRLITRYRLQYIPARDSLRNVLGQAASLINASDLETIDRLIQTINALGPSTRAERDRLRQDIDFGDVSVRQWDLLDQSGGEHRADELRAFIAEVMTANPREVLRGVLGVRAYAAIEAALHDISVDRTMPHLPPLSALFNPERMAIDPRTNRLVNKTLYDEFMDLCVAEEMVIAAKRTLSTARGAPTLAMAENERIRALAIFRAALHRLDR